MTTFEMISIAIAVFALLISTITVLFNALQIKKSSETLHLEQQIVRGNTILHFNDRLFELREKSTTEKPFDEPNWARQFWSLLSVEFYFFHHGILPTLMYSFWMIRLAEIYSGADGQHIRELHRNYLNTYSLNYPDMLEFFNEIYQKATTSGDENMRNRRIHEFITSWIAQNKKDTLA